MMTNRSVSTQKKSPWVYGLSALLTVMIIAITVFYIHTAHTHQQQNKFQITQQQQQRQEYLHWQELNRAEMSAVAGRYAECIEILAKVPTDYSLYTRVQYLNDICYEPLAKDWLADADALAAKGQFRKAIAQASQIQGGHRQAEAQQRIQTWSQTIIDVARKHYNSENGEIKEAIRILRSLPEGSSPSARGQALIESWQRLWSDNQRYYQKALLSLKENELAIATQSARAMHDHPFWNPQRQSVLLQIDTLEHTFQQIVRDAEALIEQDDLEAAVRTISNLPSTQPWRTEKIGLLAQVNTRRAERWMPLAVWATGAFCACAIFKRMRF